MTVAAAEARFEQRLRAWAASLAGPQLLAEHRAAPFGPHGLALEAVLTYLRSRPVDGKLVITHDRGAWGMARLRRDGVRTHVEPLDGPTYGSRAEAEHAVFAARLGALLDGVR